MNRCIERASRYDLIVISVCMLALLSAISYNAQSAHAQAPATASKAVPAGKTKPAVPLRAPDGRPNISGLWGFGTVTPLERPTNLKAQEFVDEETAAELTREALDRYAKPFYPDGSFASYDPIWFERQGFIKTKRSSLIIDPPDGRIPDMTPAGRKRMEDRRAQNLGHETDGPENRPLPDRCLIIQGSGPPLHPTIYNSNIQIVQTPNHVLVLSEMGHEVRMIPLDGRPHLPQSVRLWNGDPRGHWEGDTLVVESTNFTDKSPFRGSGPNMKLIERFKLGDANTLIYQFTVDDPETFVKPWTAEIPAPRIAGPLFEYACHEGNYAMTNILAGARAEEKKAAKPAQ